MVISEPMYIPFDTIYLSTLDSPETLDTYNPKYGKVQFNLSEITGGQNMTFEV